MLVVRIILGIIVLFIACRILFAAPEIRRYKNENGKLRLLKDWEQEE